MSEFMYAAYGLGIILLPLIYRLFKGPTIADMVLSMDAIAAVGACMLLVLSAEYNRSIYADIAIVIAILSFLGTLVIAKMVEEKRLR